MKPKIEAVIWDFGGVLTSSPFEAFAKYEAERGLPVGFIRNVNATNPDGNAWARFERSDITPEAFDDAFAAESRALGAEVRGRDVLGLLNGDLRPTMVAALKFCKARFKVGCITNNVIATPEAEAGPNADRLRAQAEVLGLFDHVIESSKAGVRKPDPEIYRMMTTALGVSAEACVYLDDLGINLKPARAMGMTTIKVVDPDTALAELSAAIGEPIPG